MRKSMTNTQRARESSKLFLWFTALFALWVLIFFTLPFVAYYIEPLEYVEAYHASVRFNFVIQIILLILLWWIFLLPICLIECKYSIFAESTPWGRYVIVLLVYIFIGVILGWLEIKFPHLEGDAEIVKIGTAQMSDAFFAYMVVLLIAILSPVVYILCKSLFGVKNQLKLIPLYLVWALSHYIVPFF